MSAPMHLRKFYPPLQTWLMLLGFCAMPCGAQEAAAWEKQVTGHTSITKLGRIDYEVSYSSAGFDHFSSEIVARWNDGEAQEQTLYEGIYDRPPAKVWGNGPHLCIAMQTCARYSDRCSRYVIAHRYDAQAKAFVELKSEKTARRICAAAR
ncbi:hypothetical protein [Comamonas testosteroni]|uniref:hypothetical protein n=1 Tax=Comamonas testosteroni TaxID=285 RepID=UPI00265E1BE3|nr:hypothetical protein [Comamonas testosteroni]WKL16939.1 hypothetical protein QYQ99_05250 [Comamonas testosteroni]WQD44565.1 hypothetical protein U0024_07160 [Comamonas testosteroni]